MCQCQRNQQAEVTQRHRVQTWSESSSPVQMWAKTLLFLCFTAHTRTHKTTHGCVCVCVHRDTDLQTLHVCTSTDEKGKVKQASGANPAKMLTWVCGVLNNRKTRLLSPLCACVSVLLSLWESFHISLFDIVRDISGSQQSCWIRGKGTKYTYHIWGEKCLYPFQMAKSRPP